MYPSPFISSLILLLTISIILFLKITFIIIFLKKNHAARRLALLRPVFIQQLRARTGQTAATIKAANLTGDLMDMDIPLYRIEHVRRSAVQAEHSESLLLLSLLVCTAYEDIKSFKDELVDLMEKDITGMQGNAGNLADMCRYSLTPYTLFKIALCLGSELPGEITRSLHDHNVSRDVNAIFRFRKVRRLARQFTLPVIAFLISGTVHLYGMVLPSIVSWSFLLIALMLTGLTLFLFIRKWKASAYHMSCVDIENDIKMDIPDFKLH
ncbi:MAG: hypothetical protein M8353_04255 [ANME-2 cluster archaeon]|nr:hypothetical protein [ANME-2 cluster archaeon]